MTQQDAHGRAEEEWRVLSRQLERLALALTGSASDAEDLVQQTIANLLSRRPEKALEIAYARQALVRTWLDRQRSLGRRLSRMAMKARMQARWHEDVDGLSEAETRDRVRRLVMGLPARQRAVLTMRTVESMNDAAIAEALGCSRDAVRASLHLARRAIRERWGDTP